MNDKRVKRVEVYVNGTSVAVRTDAPNAIIDSPGETRLASRSDTSYMLTGTLSDVRIYNRALATPEIATLAGK